MDEELFGAFDPCLFRNTSERVAERLERYLADRSVRGLDVHDPLALSEQARALMADSDGIAAFDEKRFSSIIDLYVRTGIQVHSPGYMGRQFSGVVPLAGAVDLVGSVMNQPASFYEAAQLPSVVEKIMGEELNRFIGWPGGTYAMITTSGGSLANLTALLAARNHRFPGIWRQGHAGQEERPAVAVGETAHYSVTRAAGILGIGEEQIIRLPVNDRQQIRLESVRPALDAAERRGLTVFCLVASAGTTGVGAFDPIDGLAGLAREKGIWLHVDGAHGASLLVSDRLRGKLRGIEKADSLTWDAHKMMFVPPPCTLLFYRNKERSLGAFRQRASYVFDETPDGAPSFDSGDKNFETTKRPMIMPLWTLWALYGRSLFAEKIECLCRLTRMAHDILRADPDFETLHEPESNILCFRYRGRTEKSQLAIRDRVNRNGRFFISKVDVDGAPALRIVVMNHQITAEHVRMLLTEIKKSAQENGAGNWVQ